MIDPIPPPPKVILPQNHTTPIFKKNRKRLFTGTVPVNKKHLTGIVPANNEHLTSTVPVNKEHLTGTL